MDFGIFMLMQQRNKHKTSHQILRDAVEQTQLADDIGFGGAWFAEHHFSNYGLCASPLVMISHCAAVTRKIRLGTGIVVAPLYQPARLIAEVAMVDQLSDGRLNLGIGSGYQHFEFERFGVKIADAPAIYNEFLDSRLEPHRKVFEVVGDKTKCQPVDGQLAGVGFSSTKRDSFVVRAQYEKRWKLYNIQVGA